MQDLPRSTLVPCALLLIAPLLAAQCTSEVEPVPAGEDQAETSEPDLCGEFTVKVIDPRNKRGLAGVDVWVVDKGRVVDSLYPDEDPLAAEQHAHQLGRRFQTDEDGEARISGGWLERPWICARFGELFGFRFASPSEYEKIALALPPDRELVVQVVDEEGHSVAGVPVGLVVGMVGVDGGRVVKERLTEGEDGEARFPHVLSAISGDNIVFPGELTLSVTFAFPLENQPRVLLPLHETLEQPVQLVLPPTGSLAVQVEIPEENASAEDHGERYRYLGQIRITDAEDSAALDFHQVERPVEGELRDERAGALFPYLGLGLELDVTVGHHRPSERFRGPERAGQRVEITTRPGRRVLPEHTRPSGVVVFIGCCLDAEGRPLAARKFRWTVSPIEPFERSGHSPWSDCFRTDEEGRFGFRELRYAGAVAGLPFSVLFQTWPRADDARECSFSLASLPDGEEIDLGALRFEPTPIALAGHVLDQEGAPIAGARCSLYGGAMAWPDSDQWLAKGDTTDEDGFFLIRGTARGEGRVLLVQADGDHHSQKRPVTLGDRNVTVRLDRIEESGSIAGVLLIDGIAPGHAFFKAGCLPQVSTERIGPLGELSGPIGPPSWSVAEGQLHFEFEGLEPGTYLIHVDLYAGESLPVLPADIVVQSGSTTKLKPFDLRQRLRGIVLKLVDRKGGAIEEEVLVSRSGGGFSYSTRRRFGAADTPPGELPLLVDAWGIDLALSVEGYRRVRLKRVRESTVVMMRPEVPLTAKLVLEKPVVLPDPTYQLYLELDPVDDDPGSKTLSDLRRGSGHFRFEGRELEVEVEEPGPWRVTWAVGGKRNGKFRLRWATGSDELPRLEILDAAEPQVFEIPSPSSELIDRLIRELKD